MSNIQIAFFGSSLLSSYWNGAATYYRGIIKALYNKGYSTTFFEPDAYDRQKHRDIINPEYAISYIYDNNVPGIKNALSVAKEADILIKASGVGVFDEFLEYEIANLKSNNNSVFFWDVDSPATLDRINTSLNDPFRQLIPLFDGILTYGGGQQVVDTYTDLGAKKCHIIYNALDCDTHYPVTKNPRFECTLGFLGNRLPDREERVFEFFAHTAKLLPEKRFLLGGNGWNYAFTDIPNIESLGHVYTSEHNCFNSSCFAILNINRQSMASYGYSPPTRIFEAAGAGACIITDKWDGIEHFLLPGKECLVASNRFDVAAYLKDIDYHQRIQIGNAARERIISEHTYEKRAEILDTIFRK